MYVYITVQERGAYFPLVVPQHWANNTKFRAYGGDRDYK